MDDKERATLMDSAAGDRHLVLHLYVPPEDERTVLEVLQDTKDSMESDILVTSAHVDTANVTREWEALK